MKKRWLDTCTLISEHGWCGRLLYPSDLQLPVALLGGGGFDMSRRGYERRTLRHCGSCDEPAVIDDVLNLL